MRDRITCAIIDDEPASQMRLQQLLALLPEVECRFLVGSAHGAADAVLSYNPDILFVGINLNGRGGFGFLEEVRAKEIDSKIIFTAHSFEYSVQALKSGAFDYLVHPIDFDELKSAIKRYIIISEEGNRQDTACDFMKKLTTKEKEIVNLLAEGKISKEIAGILGITKNTVDTHRRKIIEKAGATSTMQLIAKIKGCK